LIYRIWQTSIRQPRSLTAGRFKRSVLHAAIDETYYDRRDNKVNTLKRGQMVMAAVVPQPIQWYDPDDY
jgi:hypothetical protein